LPFSRHHKRRGVSAQQIAAPGRVLPGPGNSGRSTGLAYAATPFAGLKRCPATPRSGGFAALHLATVWMVTEKLALKGNMTDDVCAVMGRWPTAPGGHAYAAGANTVLLSAPNTL